MSKLRISLTGSAPIEFVLQRNGRFSKNKLKSLTFFQPCNGTCHGDLEYYSKEVQGILIERCYDPNEAWDCEGEPLEKFKVCKSQCYSGYVFVDENIECRDSAGLGTTFW